MESHKPVSNMIDAPQKRPLILISALLSIAILVASAFYLGLQKSAIGDEQKRIDADIVSLNTEIEILQSQNIEAAQLAQQFIESLKGQEILWSRVINRINTLLPVDAQQNPKIKILSYSGSQAGNITLNAQTQPAQIEPYEDVAEMVAVFNGSSYFEGAYVPTISRGENDAGQKFLSFIFNLTYHEEEPAVTEAGTTSSVAEGDTQEKVKVPR